MKKIILTLLILIFTAQTGFCAYDSATGEEIKGYKGSLPDVTERFQKYIPQISRPKFQSVDAFNTSKGYKPVPRDNQTYVNVILKKDPVSEFVNDINAMIPVVEKVIFSIENNENEQLFAARANFMYDNVDWLRRKYENTPDKYYPAYNALITTSNLAKTVVGIRNEAKIYSSYLPYQTDGYMYNPTYINEQVENLMTELKHTVVLMKDVN